MSGGDAGDARSYYTRTIPEQFNRVLDAEAERGEAGRPVYAKMCAVNESIQVELRGDGAEHFYLDIAGGRMTAAEAPAHTPFLTIVLEVDSYRRLASEAGDSLAGLLGALAGLGGDMKLTPRRVRELESVDGSIRFEVTGEAGFSLLTHFGSGPCPAEPDATIRMSAASYRELRAGRLDPQTAFLEDAIRTEGDMQKVMQLAFAAVAPD